MTRTDRLKIVTNDNQGVVEDNREKSDQIANISSIASVASVLVVKVNSLDFGDLGDEIAEVVVDDDEFETSEVLSAVDEAYCAHLLP